MTDDSEPRVKSICAICKKPHKLSPVTIHHILPKRYYRGRTNITPFIRFCRWCHDIVEKRLYKWELRRRLHGRRKIRKPLKPHAYFKVLEEIVGPDYLQYVYTISCWNFQAYFRLNDRNLPKPIWECQNPVCGELCAYTDSGICVHCERISLKPIWNPAYQASPVSYDSGIIIKTFAYQ